MSNTLCAGVARRVINPPLGIAKIGVRLFADPIPAIESDLTTTVLVLANGETKVAIIAADLCAVPPPTVSVIRRELAKAIGTPTSHVLFNESHNHSAPALPGFVADTPDQMALKHRYEDNLIGWLREAAVEANAKLVPARIGAGRGECHISVYRRETGPDGRDVLGEDPSVPVDPSVGVIRVDDLDGAPIAILFSYGCHPVTMGPRAMVGSTDFPGPARDVIEKTLGGIVIFLQGCGGNINPVGGIGYEVDCRDTKNRAGFMLGGEALKVASDIRTQVRRGDRVPLGNIPNILFTPWVPVEGDTCTYLGASEQVVKLEYVELPTMAEAQRIDNECKQILADKRATGAQDWEIRLAQKRAEWSEELVRAVRVGHPTADLVVQVIRVNEIVIAALNVEAFFQTGLAIKSSSPFEQTIVLGFSNGVISYLPRAADYPAGGWKLNQSYAVPDMLFHFSKHPVALHPNSEQVAVESTVNLIHQLAAQVR